MVMLARALALDTEILNPRIVLVTDRVDLDDQLKNTFAACRLEPQKTNTGRHLLELVSISKTSVITTVINKFDTALKGRRDFKDLSEDVFLLVDESHRSQYGEIASRMRRVFPNACYLGFTGTPLMKNEKSTFEKFGGLIDVYAIDQAVKDGAVVPLLYEGRFVEREVNQQGIDQWFDRVSLGLTNDQKAVPSEIRNNALSIAFFHTLEKAFGSNAGAADHNIRSTAAAAATAFSEIVDRHRVVNWTHSQDVQNAMRNDMDDCLFDVVRDHHGMEFSPAVVSEIVETALQAARLRSAQ
jgi:type I site-specific restriction-modification system R (restriction) subunit